MNKLSTRVGYVLKRYPRYSETFVVNEILAHELAGLNIDIFALRPPCDTHFQNIIFHVRASVTYIPKPTQGRVSNSLNTLSPTPASYFWAELQETAQVIPDFWQKLAIATGERASVVYQGAWLAREIRLRNITHLHAHFGSVATSVARLAAYFAGIPYTFTAHAKDIFHESVDFADLSQKIRDSQAVVAVSAYNCRYLREIYGKVADSVQKIYNSIDLTKFTYLSPKNIELTFTFYQFEAELHSRLRATNLLERIFEEFRGKADEIGSFPNEMSCLTLFFLVVQREHAKHNRPFP